jgi:hypothetical protein
MNALFSLNIFAEFALAAVIGIALFFGLLALPLFVSGDWPPAADRRARLQKDRSAARDSTCPCLNASSGRSH